jgi:hypothetical protein
MPKRPRHDPQLQAEAKAAYQSAIVDADHFRDASGNVKAITRTLPSTPRARCIYCGEPFEANRQGQKYCSNKCQRRDYKRSVKRR